MYFYYLKEYYADGKGIYVSSAIVPEKVKLLILYILAKVSMDISENFFINTEDMVQLLVNHFGFARHTVVDSGKPIKVIDLLQLWNDSVEAVEDIAVAHDYQDPNLDNEILELFAKPAKIFLFINAAAVLPKWAEDVYVEPLKLQVTHM